MPDLVGSFFFADGGEHYSTGEVLAEASPGHYLVRYDGGLIPGEPVAPMELVSVADMAAQRWLFFGTREERDRWTAWLETPSEPRMSVVRPINPRDRH